MLHRLLPLSKGRPRPHATWNWRLASSRLPTWLPCILTLSGSNGVLIKCPEPALARTEGPALHAPPTNYRFLNHNSGLAQHPELWFKEFVISWGRMERGAFGAGKGWFWALGVGTPFDPDKVKMHGSHVGSLDEAKRQFQVAWGTWPTLLSGNETGEALARR